MTVDAERYPIGKFAAPSPISRNDIDRWIHEIERLPDQVRRVVQPLAAEQLDTPYREGGWTIRQVVHHLADSHMNSVIRFKLALTEDRPTIRPYFEERWAELADVRNLSISLGLDFLTLLHARWAILLQGMKDAEWKREFIHPDSGLVTLERNAGIYAWHGSHHLAHITRLLERRGWTSA